MAAEKVLMKEFKELQQEKWVNISMIDDNIMKWDVALIVLNTSSLYYGGYFKAQMSFPSNYPYSPPTFKFIRPLLHPNVYKDGKLCISILHTPGEDAMSGELASERWSPAQRVETVLLSILSLLDDAEVSSPANVDAGVLLRTNPEEYKRKVKECVEASKRDIPEDFVMPDAKEAHSKKKDDFDDGDEFWAESGDEDDFSFGEDEDEEMEEDEEEEGEDAEEQDEEDEAKKEELADLKK